MNATLPSQIVIVGAGYTAHHLVHQLLSDPSCTTQFVLTSRQPEKNLSELLEHARVSVVELDLLDEQLEEHLDARMPELLPDAAVIYSAPTLFRSYEPASQAGELARHTRPLDSVVRWAARAHARSFVYLSSTSVYGNHEGGWVDEESDCDPESALGRMRLDLENHLESRSWGGEGEMHACYIARIVGIYGPGRTLADYIARGSYKLVDEGKKVTNRIHVDDLSRAILAMLMHGEPGFHRYNVSDGHPLTVRWLVRYLVEHHGVEMPDSVSLETYAEERGDNVAARWRSTYRCSSKKLQTELGWKPRYRNALHGLEKILNA